MKLKMPDFKSIFGSSSPKVTQSTKIDGDHNNVTQTIVVFEQGKEELGSDWLVEALPSSTPPNQPFVDFEASQEDETEEIKRILKYRQIATDGDSAAALKLLEELKSYKKYSNGYLAFRINFNIGMIQQNIGKTKSASESLRLACECCPEDKKAQAGLAFAKLIDGENEDAFKRAKGLMETSGEHQNLATVVAYYAAASLQEEFRIEDYELQDPPPVDVVAARLEYMRKLRPDEYPKALRKAFNTDPSNSAVASKWAMLVLDDINKNQAFLLGARTPEVFDEEISKSAAILRSDLEKSLRQRPPNKPLLLLQTNNAAVALRLAGNINDARKILDRTNDEYPEFQDDLAQLRAVLLLQLDKYTDAFEIIDPIKGQPELQIMASEIEAELDKHQEALDRINVVLKMDMPEQVRLRALVTKARIGINSLSRNAADEAIEELEASCAGSSEAALLRSAYTRAFDIQFVKEDQPQPPVFGKGELESDRELLAALSDVESRDFFSILQVADELMARGYFRKCADLLRERVSYSKESPALRTLCDACLHGRLGSLAREISERLPPSVKNSEFGWKFDAQVGYLTGDIAKAVPLTRKLFEQNSKSIRALEWYVQSLLRTYNPTRICRVVGDLNDFELTGAISEKSEYVKLLVFCGEIERARAYAYRLFCENRNDYRAWMAISSSVLALGGPPGTSDDLNIEVIEENSAFEVLRPDGEKQTYIVENDEQLCSLRDENIPTDHLIAKAAMAKRQGETFTWPFSDCGEEAAIVSVKHKVLEAFHFVLKRFEEQFPDASGFRSIKFDASKEGGLDEIKAMLQQRVEYAEQKAKEYHQGSFPLPVLGFHLGIDPIDTFLGLSRECGFAIKVSTCTREDQDKASAALRQARTYGIIADAVSCYLIRRIALERPIEQEFGRIGVTQNTVDIFSRRLRDAEQTTFFEAEDGIRTASSISGRDGKIILSELTEDDVNAKIGLLRGDLIWLQSDCTLVPAAAKTDPSDAVIRIRGEEGGQFFDDIFAADGSDRIFLSDDFHLRQWAEKLFSVRCAWVQALLFHLEEAGRISIETTIKGTVQLCNIGEEALSINTERLLTGVKMLETTELTKEDFNILCSVLGQPGANMSSHIGVAASAINGIWTSSRLSQIPEQTTSIILKKLIRHQGKSSRDVLDAIHPQLRDERAIEYIDGWRIGHFLR